VPGIIYLYLVLFNPRFRVPLLSLLSSPLLSSPLLSSPLLSSPLLSSPLLSSPLLSSPLLSSPLLSSPLLSSPLLSFFVVWLCWWSWLVLVGLGWSWGEG